MRRSPPDALRFPTATRIATGAILVAIAVAFAVVTVGRHHRDLTMLQIFLGVASVMLGFAAVEVFGVAHRLVPGGIERVTPWRRRVLIRWSDVVDVRWSTTARGYELRSNRGERIRVDHQLAGIDAFARAALEGIPPSVIERRHGLRTSLENTARGIAPHEPPSDSPG